MKDFDAVLEKKIRTFVDELQELVRQVSVEAVRNALGVKTPKAAKPRPRKATKPTQAAPAPKGRAARVQGGRRTPEQLERTVTTVRRHVQTNPGQSVEQISKALGVSSKTLVLPLAKLLRSRELRKTGIKRNTKYFPIESTPAKSAKELGSKPRNAKK